jgi:hypothetical protein
MEQQTISVAKVSLQLSLLSADFSGLAPIDYRLLNTGRHGDQAAYAHKHYRMLQS